MNNVNASNKNESNAANEAWNRREGETCLQLIEEIASNSEDPKVKGNLAAARFLAENQAGKRYDAAEIKGIADAVLPFPKADGAASPDQIADSVLLILNSATALFNARQAPAAAKLLAPVWQAIEKDTIGPSVTEDLTLGACFLLLDVEFACKAYSHVAAVLTWLERQYDLVSDDEKESDGRVSGVDNASSVSGEFSLQASPGSPHTSELWLNWRARLSLVTGDLRAVKKQIRSLLTMDLSNPQAVSLKAELEALRGNFKRAGKLITSRAPGAGPAQGLEEVQLLCNMAYLQHCEGKFNTAVLCYSKALELAVQNRPALTPLVDNMDVKPSSANISGAEVAILYSCGVQALLVKQHDLAHDCFQKCAPAMFKDPVLWLRMGECCQGASLAQQPLKDIQNSLGDAVSGNPSTQEANGRQQASMEETLQFGKQCATNSVFLFSCQLAELGKNADGQSPPNGLESHTDGSTQGGEDYQKGLESRQKQRHLAGKRNALCLCAFLSLQLNHAASALHAALDLLEIAEEGTREWQLAQAYASEALYHLGKPTEAAEHLQTALEAIIEASSQDQVHKVRTSSESDEKGKLPQSLTPEALHSVKVAVLVNLASTYFMMGDMPQASEFARESAADDENRDAVLANAYIQLCRGDTSSALSQLKAFQLGIASRT